MLPLNSSVFLEIHAHLLCATVVNFRHQLERLHLKVGRFADDPNFSGTWHFSFDGHLHPLVQMAGAECSNFVKLPSFTPVRYVGMEHLRKLIATLDAARIFRFACLKRQVVQGEIMTRHNCVTVNDRLLCP